MGRLFGTDGVRGVANSELTCEMAMNIGRAAAMVLTDSNHRHPKVLIGKDTRLSSDMLEAAITAGLCSVGANVVQLGVVPTPAVAFLVGKYKADAGVMLTASHNPCEFNGIKIFSGDGYKLPDALEEQIEAIVLDHVDGSTGAQLRGISAAWPLRRMWCAIMSTTSRVRSPFPWTVCGLESTVPTVLRARTAELLFTELGAECHMLANQPNGVNVNDDCGSTHMEALMSLRDVRISWMPALLLTGMPTAAWRWMKTATWWTATLSWLFAPLDMKSRGKLDKNTAGRHHYDQYGLYQVSAMTTA